MFQNEEERVIQVDITDEMEKSFLDYSMSVIVSRALPDVRDGLKPVHRRILYTMYENGLTPDKGYRKCADTVGSVLGRYHPHGDSSVYDALVRLARDFSLRYPLVDGHGNFGSIDGDPAAAYRYTEAKMSQMSTHLLTDIEKETIDFVPNYDDRLKEPEVLPARFPNLLVNGSMGIAVGMATNIPPHNLTEVIDGVVCLIDNPDADLNQLMEHIKGPDFPTGGMIMGYTGIRAAYATGRGRVILRGKAEVKDIPGDREQIVITELPYNVNKSRLIENIAELVKDKRIDGITNIQDYSDRNGINVVISLRRDANAQIVLNHLYSLSQLQTTEGVIMLALHKGQPKVMTLKEMLQHYIDFQCEVIVRRTEFDLRRAKNRAHILEGLLIAQDNIDEVINIFRTSSTVQIAKDRLIERFEITEEQANAIAQMTMSRLTGLEREKLEGELAELKITIAELEEILGSELKVHEIIKEELVVLRDKYGDDRRTEILPVSGEVDIEDLIPEEDCVITITHYGYVKRQPVDTYKTQRRGGRGVSGMDQREEDFVEELFISSSHDFIMFFTDKGRVFRIKAYEIPESSRTSRGMNIVNLLELQEDETVSATICITCADDDAFLVMMTKNGIIKRTLLSEYKNVRRSGIIAVNLDDDDELVGVRITHGENELIVATKKGMSIRFHETEARAIGRTARGVKAIDLDSDDEVVGFARVWDDATLLTVSEDGKGRRTYMKEYRAQKRGGKGLRNYYTDKYGNVAGVRTIEEDDDVILISDDGIIIRIPAHQISVQSRYASGVNVMRLDEGSRVVTLARSPKEDEEDFDEDNQNEEGLEENQEETTETQKESTTNEEPVEENSPEED